MNACTHAHTRACNASACMHVIGNHDPYMHACMHIRNHQSSGQPISEITNQHSKYCRHTALIELNPIPFVHRHIHANACINSSSRGHADVGSTWGRLAADAKSTYLQRLDGSHRTQATWGRLAADAMSTYLQRPDLPTASNRLSRKWRRGLLGGGGGRE